LCLTNRCGVKRARRVWTPTRKSTSTRNCSCARFATRGTIFRRITRGLPSRTYPRSCFRIIWW
jgi:hypothetical protein